MIKKFEKLETKEVLGVSETNFKEVAEKDAEYIHYCGHDKNPPEPCKRKKILNI